MIKIQFMEKCYLCKEDIDSSKLLKCKICENIFCSIGCLIKHASVHQQSEGLSMNIVNLLKRRQSENLTEYYSFITTGDFKENHKSDDIYSKENFKKVMINGFFPHELGSGAFGHVYLIRNIITNEEFALKVIEKKKLIQMYGKIDIIRNEISIHSKLIHENIIRLYSVYEEDDNFNFIMEYAKHGNLYELLSLPENQKGFDEQRAFDYFIQVVNAVYYLHLNSIIHRDIKPENILIGSKGLLKLCDFGWAKELNLENRSTFCGTMEYMAPEIVGCGNYDYSVDIWSLGILLYELLFGHSPFKAQSMKDVMLNIKNHDLTYDKSISIECKDLINKLLNINPQKRLKIRDILQHPFVQKYSKNYLIRKKLEFNYNDKNISPYMNTTGKKGNNSIPSMSINLFSPQKTPKKVIPLTFSRQKCNTNKYIGSKTKSIFNILNDSNKCKISLKKNCSINCFNDGNIKKVRTEKEKYQTEKKKRYIKKLQDSFYTEIKKMKKKMDSISFKNTECCTFEDIRDVHLSSQKSLNHNAYVTGKIKKISLSKVFDKYRSTKNITNNIPNIYNSGKKLIFTMEDNENNVTNNNNKDIKNNIKDNKNNDDLSDLFDNEEKAMIERLNKAYIKFGKEQEKENYIK